MCRLLDCWSKSHLAAIWEGDGSVGGSQGAQQEPLGVILLRFAAFMDSAARAGGSNEPYHERCLPAREGQRLSERVLPECLRTNLAPQVQQ